jgi:hypothetical protein
MASLSLETESPSEDLTESHMIVSLHTALRIPVFPMLPLFPDSGVLSP